MRGGFLLYSVCKLDNGVPLRVRSTGRKKLGLVTEEKEAVEFVLISKSKSYTYHRFKHGSSERKNYQRKFRSLTSENMDS